jgi:hypothetical protein
VISWAWRAEVDPTDVEREIARSFAARGFVPATARAATVFVVVHDDGEGGALVLSAASGGLAIAGALSRTLGVAARYAEIDMRDREVFAGAREIAADGTPGTEHDESADATELCEVWFEGKKYRVEASDDLGAYFVGLDTCPEDAGSTLSFALATGESARVRALLDAVAAGAKWERTAVGGRTAIKVKDAAGTRIAVLDATELEAFERNAR